MTCWERQNCLTVIQMIIIKTLRFVCAAIFTTIWSHVIAQYCAVCRFSYAGYEFKLTKTTLYSRRTSLENMRYIMTVRWVPFITVMSDVTNNRTEAVDGICSRASKRHLICSWNLVKCRILLTVHKCLSPLKLKSSSREYANKGTTEKL